MSADDDRLAPVTPLFGQQHPAGGGGRRDSTSDGWVAPGEAGLGPDESVGSSEPVDVEPARRDEPSRPAEPAHPVEHSARIVALPTYAAFAPDDVEPGSGFGSEDDAEPEESLEAAAQRAENISLHALSRRGVSSLEMQKTLRSRDLPEEVVLAEVERLERVGLLNDAELAENLVHTKQDRKGLGKGAIASELRQRGLAQEAIDQAIAEIDDDEEQTRADEWAVKRAGQLRGLDQATAERRLNAFLTRRGYRSEVVRRAVEKALPRSGSQSRSGSRGGGVRFE